MKKCNVEGCERTDIHGHGMCLGHYRQWWRSNAKNKDREKEAERNRRKINPEKEREKQKRYYARNKDKVSERHKIWMRTLRGRYVTAKLNANQVGLDWTIEFEDFQQLLSQKCYYCGLALHETGSGLDRLDNKVGYALDNVVTCCNDCNIMRGRRLTHDETVLVP